MLFLGQITLRKGVGPLFTALERLAEAPVNTTFVGPVQVDVPAAIASHPSVRFTGPVPRDAVAAAYAQADVMLFPTLSDGFGLTQLEALAAGLPVIASRHCGAVVEDGVIGLLLDTITPDTIATAIGRLLAEPRVLARMAAAAPAAAARFGLGQLADRLEAL